jgi:dihydropteroate synthase
MVAEGAAVIDVGGESTRPGATRISPEQEQDRVLPTVAALVDSGITVSVDTMNASTARLAIAAGVSVINDVSAGLGDPDMMRVIADSSVDYVLMHGRGPSETMDDKAVYESVVDEVIAELGFRIEAAQSAGITRDRIIVDPGVGSAKDPHHNWELLAGLDRLVGLGFRVLVGVSRKRFLGELLPPANEPAERDGVTATLGALMADAGVWALRVHKVAQQRQALSVWQALGQRSSQ